MTHNCLIENQKKKNFLRKLSNGKFRVFLLAADDINRCRHNVLLLYYAHRTLKAHELFLFRKLSLSLLIRLVKMLRIKHSSELFI